MSTVLQQPPVALDRISSAALSTSGGQGSDRNQQHGSAALGRLQSDTQPSSTQQIVQVGTASGAHQSSHYASFYKRLANTVTNVALISIGLVIAGVYGKIAERQGNESLKATLWRDCIDLPDTVGTTETCKKLLAAGFDSLSKRSIQIQQHGVPSRPALFWEELFALEELYVVPSLLWIAAFGLDVLGRIVVNTISLMMLFSTHSMLTAAMDTDQSVWAPQKRRFLPMLKVWRRWLDLFSFVIGQIVGYLLWHWGNASSPRRSASKFVAQALQFYITIYVFTMILRGNILQKLSAGHTSGALDISLAGCYLIYVSVNLLFWMYQNAFQFISPNTVNQWQDDSRESLSAWLVVTITPVVATLAMLKIPIARQGFKYIVFK